MTAKITNYILAGYPALFIVSHEEQRVEKDLLAVAKSTEFTLQEWSITEGITSIAETTVAISET